MTHSGKNRARRFAGGFTLIELAVVISIIALVTAMGVTSGIAVISSARQSATYQKMAVIDQALLAYRIANDRLPCPGDYTLTSSSSNYGYEAGYASGGTGTGECKTGMTPAANNETISVNPLYGTAAEGAVPTATLGISNDFMYDGWGNHIRYAVDISLTPNGVFPVTALGCNAGPITIYDANGNTRSTRATYALISHGPNGHGGYTRNGVIYNAGSTNSNELTDCHCSSSATLTSYAPTYVQAPYYLDPTTNTDNFDDLVTFKERWQLQTNWDPAGSVCGIGSIFIADYGNYRIRKVTVPTGVISTYGGSSSGNSGNGGQATAGEWGAVYDIGSDSSGNIYVGDYTNCVVRKITASSGLISTVAGSGSNCNTSGGTYGGNGGQATATALGPIRGVAADSSGNIYISDPYNERIEKVATTGIMTTYAGTGTWGTGGDGGLATAATIAFPNDVTVDNSGNVYITTISDCRVRKVTASSGVINTVAGNGTCGAGSGDGGQATSAVMNLGGTGLDSGGNIYVADDYNCAVREVVASTGVINTVAGTLNSCSNTGDSGQATAAKLNDPWKVAVDNSGNLYIADVGNNRIRKVTMSTGIISAYAANGSWGNTGDGGQATAAEIENPFGIAIIR